MSSPGADHEAVKRVLQRGFACIQPPALRCPGTRHVTMSPGSHQDEHPNAQPAGRAMVSTLAVLLSASVPGACACAQVGNHRTELLLREVSKGAYLTVAGPRMAVSATPTSARACPRHIPGVQLRSSCACQLRRGTCHCQELNYPVCLTSGDSQTECPIFPESAWFQGSFEV